MGLIYRAANIVEAQLVVDELRAGGMQSHVTGSYLSGAIGELPPTEVIGVWLIEDRHSQRARSIIDDFEASRKHSAGPDWFCRQCGESVGEQFGACWQCGKARLVDNL